MNVDIFVILKEDAEEHKRKSIHNVAAMVQQFLDDEIMRHTIEAMADKPLIGEPSGNCHNIALAFMTDLINSGRAKGWFGIQGGNLTRINDTGKAWKHSWLEYDGFAVDASTKQKGMPDQPTITIDETRAYYKQRDIKKIFKRRDAGQTRRWIFRQGA